LNCHSYLCIFAADCGRSKRAREDIIIGWRTIWF
jgi:hypothetical protein